LLSSLAEQVKQYKRGLTVAELASILGISGKQIYKLVTAKRLPAIKVGTMIRFDPGVTVGWIHNHMTVLA
jgi:excisionase family DNA binding protein